MKVSNWTNTWQILQIKDNLVANWKWFPCSRNGKCIHPDSRCDLHPHPQCIYEDENGDLLSEDEEDCFDEYKYKGIIDRSASFTCDSQIHNIESLPVTAKLNMWLWAESFVSLKHAKKSAVAIR